MSENIKLDVIRLIKEVSKQNIDNFELEYEGMKIKMSASKLVKAEEIPSSNVLKQDELPEASEREIEEMQRLEQKTIADRIKERDDSLLYELDYLAPEIAGDLRRSNIIKLSDSGDYEYVEEGETVNA